MNQLTRRKKDFKIFVFVVFMLGLFVGWQLCKAFLDSNQCIDAWWKVNIGPIGGP